MSSLDTTNFWSNELRGYRLLKAAHLTRQERQNVLTQTNNATDFDIIKRALRALFAEDETAGRPQQQKRCVRSALWNDAGNWDDDAADGEWEDYDETWYYEPNDTYWQEENADWQWDDESSYNQSAFWNEEDEIMPDENADDADEVQFREAFALANEATRTLKEARDAVKKVRMA